MAKKSIVVKDMQHCMICGSPYIQIHHCFYGTANRKISDRLGLVVPLCQEHHTGNNGVHFDKKLDMLVKTMAQGSFENQIGSREDFRRLFGRSYL